MGVVFTRGGVGVSVSVGAAGGSSVGSESVDVGVEKKGIKVSGGATVGLFTPPGGLKSGAEAGRGLSAQAKLTSPRRRRMVIKFLTLGECRPLAFDRIFGTTALPGFDRFAIFLKVTIIFITQPDRHPSVQHERE